MIEISDMRRKAAWSEGNQHSMRGVVRAGLKEWGTFEQTLKKMQKGPISEGAAIPAEGTGSAKGWKLSVLGLFWE